MILLHNLLFLEKGKPVLRLIGDVKPVSIIAEKSKNGIGIRITDDPKAPAFKIEQESAFKSKYTLDHSDLLKSCKARYSDFRQGEKFNDLKKNILKMDKKYADQWPANYKKPKLIDPYFYSTECYKVLDKYYKKKNNHEHL
ncbi:MAG: hypothetical protein EOM19_07265 [Candidatus Moranbacteria bacterium]|nr:hypothetical protein [Candidatus Moranbacteria bacterium]